MKKKVLSVLIVFMMCLGLAGCGGGSNSASDDISGKVSLNGSTSMEKFVNALSEGIKEKYPNLQLEAQFTGSGAGLEAVASKTTDIGDSSRALTDEEKAKGLEENIVATGQITNWKDLGGQDEAIVVIGREAGSGTRGAFEELLGIEEQCQYAQELNETGAVLAKVAKTSGSIGYVSLDVLDDTVSPLQLDGVEPSEKTVKDGSYTLQRPFVMATNGKISEQSKQVQAVFDFINSDAGQKIIEKVGLVTPNK